MAKNKRRKNTRRAARQAAKEQSEAQKAQRASRKEYKRQQRETIARAFPKLIKKPTGPKASLSEALERDPSLYSGPLFRGRIFRGFKQDPRFNGLLHDL